MALLEETPGLLEALRGEMTPKFLATSSTDGVPNVVPLITLLPADDRPDTLFFGNFLLRKSIRNLKEDPRVGILVITPALHGWRLRGEFVEFQRTGPYVERQMSGSLLRYNAYTGVRDAGIIRVREVIGAFDLPRLQVAGDYLRARLGTLGRRLPATGGTRLPRAVRIEYARMVAVKVLAWIGTEGFPEVVPALSLQPAGNQHLTCTLPPAGATLPASGAQVAANILTFDAVSYQAKGRWQRKGTKGFLHVEEVYAGGPPLPGGRIA